MEGRKQLSVLAHAGLLRFLLAHHSEVGWGGGLIWARGGVAVSASIALFSSEVLGRAACWNMDQLSALSESMQKPSFPSEQNEDWNIRPCGILVNASQYQTCAAIHISINKNITWISHDTKQANFVVTEQFWWVSFVHTAYCFVHANMMFYLSVELWTCEAN